jgi:signal peptidase
MADEKKEKSLWGYLSIGLSSALLVLVLGLAVAVIVLPLLVGGKALTVLTQSMEPGLPPGTLIVVRPTPVDDITIGQVLTYQIESGKPALISHRVISRINGLDGTTSFVTLGDNNDVADPNPVQEVQVVGTLWYSIPKLGYVNNWINGEARTFIVPAVAGGLFIYAGVMITSALRARRSVRRKARQT